jgi:YD repeat-containing protein
MLLLTTPTPLLAQQGGTARYVYDDNGRLVAVISPTGEANVYDYDAAGNFTAIRRLTTNDLAVLTFSPRSGLPGDVITFVGVGFGNGVSNVSFNGASAQIVSFNANTIVVVVPQAATTGPVSITTSKGTVSTALPFVLKGVRVTPASPRVFPGNTIQFSALVQVGSSDPTVLWSVNGVNGGNSTVGTITQNGFYTAPATPGTGIVVRATSVSVPTLFGEANVTILNPDDFRNVVSTGLTVKIPDNAGGIFSQTASFSSGVTVQVPTGTQGNITQTAAFSPGLTVQLPTATSGTINQTSGFSPGLTVQLPTPTAGTISQMGPVSPGVTVQLPSSTSGTITQTGAFSLGVSASRGPVVSSVSPNQRSRGTSSTITVTGMNFQSASGVQFTLSGALDNNLSVSNFVVSGDGSSITFTLTISVNASLGQRVLIITTPQGHSPTIGSVSNMLEVIP